MHPVCTAPSEFRRGHRIPWNWSYIQVIVSQYVDARNQMPSVRKNSKCS